MEKKKRKRLYEKEEINKAYNMGLESAVVILEQSFKLSRADRWRLIEYLKKNIIKNKIAALNISKYSWTNFFSYFDYFTGNIV